MINKAIKNTYYKSLKIWRLKRIRGQPTDKETFAKDLSDIGLFPKIYKEHLKLNNKKMNQPIKKMGKRPEQTLH